MSNAELASSYAALILADDGIEITVRSSSPGLTGACEIHEKIPTPPYEGDTPSRMRLKASHAHQGPH